jgi:hypothetical protein
MNLVTPPNLIWKAFRRINPNLVFGGIGVVKNICSTQIDDLGLAQRLRGNMIPVENRPVLLDFRAPCRD